MILTYQAGDGISHIQAITKLEAVIDNTTNKLVAYRVYTGPRPTEHRYLTTIPAEEVLKITGYLEEWRRPCGS